MLLDGKSLTYGRRSIAIPKEGEIPEELKRWLGSEKAQKNYIVVVDTNELMVDIQRRA